MPDTPLDVPPKVVLPGIWRWRIGTPPPSLGVVAELDLDPGDADALPPRTCLTLARGRCSTAVRVTDAEGVSLYATGETAGPLERTGKRTVCWNTDTPAYDERDRALYQSHPWLVGVREDGSAFGVLVDTTCKCSIDLRSGIHLRAKTFDLSIYLLEAASPEALCELLATLIGTIELPPLWALGYHQCRWSYDTADRVREVAREFRERHIPCDAIWMDIDYMDRYRVFTFDGKRFPDPHALSETLHDAGFHGVWMIDCGVSAEEGYHAFDSGEAAGVWVTMPDGSAAAGPVWPERCVFPDFTAPSTRAWWRDLHPAFLDVGVDGIWNDMNEPSVLTHKHATLPLDARHRGGDLGDGRLLPPADHATYHNVYGTLMARVTHEAWKEHRPDKRPFVLTRSGSMGSHRYAATWTGDNRSRWEDLRWSVTMALNMGLSGQPFVGPDIGGFNDHCDGPLMARWMGVGALLPFARGHAEKSTNDKEPWAFGPEVEATCRRAIERRYRLLPYLYTAFEQASRTGVPVVRPAFFADPALRTTEDVFLLGPDVAVCCRLDPDAPLPPPPAGFSRRFELVEGGLEDADLPALYLRDGAAIVVGPVVQHVQETARSMVRIVASPDANGNAQGSLYEDAGDGYGHLRGEYRRSMFSTSVGGWQYAGTEGTYPTAMDDHIDRHDLSVDGPQVP